MEDKLLIEINKKILEGTDEENKRFTLIKEIYLKDNFNSLPPDTILNIIEELKLNKDIFNEILNNNMIDLENIDI